MENVLNYGMSTVSLAERLGETLDEAQKVVDGYYGGLTGVKKYTDDSQAMLKKLGYVTDLWGRRRHIPDATLPEYEIKPIKEVSMFNPLLYSCPHRDEKLEKLISKYKTNLKNARWKKDRDKIIEQAEADGLTIKNNNGFISRALRQCLNARIQGSSASMTKLAMIMAHNDKELNDLGFKIVLTVHDEFAGIVPTENSVRAGERLGEIMVEAAQTKCGNVPWKCDPYVVRRWYNDEFSAEVLNEYTKVGDVEEIIQKYPMIKPEYIKLMCEEKFDVNLYEDI